MNFKEEITEYRLLYSSNKNNPQIIRFEIELKDNIDGNILRNAINITMKRYPYFNVKLIKENNKFYYINNDLDVVLFNSNDLFELNSVETNYHSLYFSYYEKTLTINVFHVLTDGSGSYELLKTLLYYYISNKYNEKIDKNNIRLYGDVIPKEEFENPFDNIKLPDPPKSKMTPAYTPKSDNSSSIINHIVIKEDEFIAKVKELNATPNILISILLSNIIFNNNDIKDEIVRIAVCVDERKALRAPLAHQSLVGGAMLDFDSNINKMNINEKSKIMRDNLKIKSSDDYLLYGIASQRGLVNYILSEDNDDNRINIVQMINKGALNNISATVSYVRNSGFNNMDRYINDFRVFVSATTSILVEISAIGGNIYLDLIHSFKSDLYLKAFLNELDNLNLKYELKYSKELKQSNIKLPWDN